MRSEVGPERWQQIEQLYQAALEREAGLRSVFVKEACGEDESLRKEVEWLLAQADANSNFLEAPALEIAAKALAEDQAGVADAANQSGPTPGYMISHYRMLQKVGSGGMGDVWLAEQKQPVRRRVALKLIKAGMDTREVVARFESERQALALMNHPAIAKVFDGGSTEQGRPYFVMEYVAGIPITIYCDKHQLSLRERLELFIHVCEAVQHAHQKAIIHRDLKPSNILVAEVDGKPLPKIIDFGVAKAMLQRLSEETMVTRVGVMLGTPEYMSPEQADSAGEDIDTRSDVYSLGVILYELLVGALPLDLGKLSFDEMLRRLREGEPARPSTKLRELGAQSTDKARNRRTEPKRLAKQLRGDLDSIMLKALEKERSRRYRTPSEFAEDIERYLRDDPVMARPPSVGYRARKYIRRHRIGVVVAAGLIVLLAAFAITQAFELRTIRRERDRADRITIFMTDMFKVSNPSEARGKSITAREILDKASKDIGTGLVQDPELQAQMMQVMGTVYIELGLYSRAQSLLQRAVETRQRVLGSEHPNTLTSMASLAGSLNLEGHYADAEKLERQVVALQSRILGAENRETLHSIVKLANFLTDETRFPEAEKLQRQALDAQRRTLGPEDRDTVETMDDLATTLDEEGKYPESEKLTREALGIQSRRLGPEDPATVRPMFNLGVTLTKMGRYAESEKLERAAVDISRRTLGPEHSMTLHYVGSLAADLMTVGQYDEAQKLLEQTREIQARVLGPEHPETAASSYYLACVALRRGQRDQALALLREAIEHGLEPYFAVGIGEEPDFKALHGDPRFEALVSEARARAAQAAKSK